MRWASRWDFSRISWCLECDFLACEEEYKGREEEGKKIQLTLHQSIPQSEHLLFENFSVRSFFGEKTSIDQILFILD